MSSLITQTLDQLPQVLLVGDTGELRDRLVEHLRQKQLDVVVVSPSELLATRDINSLVALDSVYRLILSVDHLAKISPELLQYLTNEQSPQEWSIITGSTVGIFDEKVSSSFGVSDLWKTQLFVLEKLHAAKNITIVAGAELLLRTSSTLFLWQNVCSLPATVVLPVKLPVLDVDVFAKLAVQQLLRPRRQFFTHFLAEPSRLPSQILRDHESASLKLVTSLLGEKHLSAPAAQTMFVVMDALPRSHYLGENATADAAASSLLPKPAVPVAPVPVASEPVHVEPPVKVAQPLSSSPSTKPFSAAPITLASSKQQGRELTISEKKFQTDATKNDTLWQGSGRPIQTTPLRSPKIQNRMKMYEDRKREQLKTQAMQVKLATPQQKVQKLGKKMVEQPASQVSDKDLERSVYQLFGVERQQEKLQRIEQKVEVVVAAKKKSGRQKWVMYLAGIFLGIAVFSGVLLATYGLSTYFLNKQFAEFATNFTQLSPAEQQYRSVELQKTATFVAIQTEMYGLVLGQDVFAKTRREAEIQHALASAIFQGKSTHDQAITLVSIFRNKSEKDFFEQYLAVSQTSQQQYQQLSLVVSHLQSLRADAEDQSLPEIFQLIEPKVQELRRASVSLQQLDSLIPSLFAQNSRRTYAMLVENPQELRPAGGLVEAVVLVTIEKGKMFDYQVLDVNKLDAQLSGNLTAPADLQKSLSQQRLLLRDVGWSADVPTVASNAKRFIENTTNKRLDGVFVVTTDMFQSLIAATGPLTVENYDEEVTDKTLPAKLEFHSELAVTDQAKEPYVVALTRSMFKQVLSDDQKTLAAVEVLYQQLRTANAFFVPFANNEQIAVSGLGWVGDVATPSCPSQITEDICVIDTMFQVEANTGINKANYALKRTIKQDVLVQANAIQHQRFITYENQSKSNAWPAGPYKAYVRFFVPDSVSTMSAKVNDVSVPITEEKTDDQKQGKRIFGMNIEVTIGQKATVELDYSLPRPPTNAFSYAFFEQRQAGSGEDPWQLSLKYVDPLRPVLVAPQATVSRQEILFNQTRDKHEFVGVRFSP